MNIFDFLIVFLIGYYLGTKRSPKQDLKSLRDSANKWANDNPKDTPTGQIKSPTARELLLRKDPRKAEGINAMKQTLDNTPELKAHKDYVERMKREGKIIL